MSSNKLCQASIVDSSKGEKKKFNILVVTSTFELEFYGYDGGATRKLLITIKPLCHHLNLS